MIQILESKQFKKWKSFLPGFLFLIFQFHSVAEATPLPEKKGWEFFPTLIKLINAGDYPPHYQETATLPNSEKKPHVVFLISKDPDNYQAHKTIPQFADMLAQDYGFETTVLLGKGDLSAYRFPNPEIISEADLLVIFCRRLALPYEQLEMIKSYLNKGKPLVGIRTANHAFSVRSAMPEGHEAWWDFVPDIVGCENRGYGSSKEGTEVAVVPEADNHPILNGIEPKQWSSMGNVYHVAPLTDQSATILLTGTAGGKVEPIAWTRTAGKSRVFYTSLGYPEDFQQPQFLTLLINGIRWALD